MIGFVKHKKTVATDATVLFLFIAYKAIALQYLKILCKALIKRLNLLAKVLLCRLADGNNISFAVGLQPYKAA